MQTVVNTIFSRGWRSPMQMLQTEHLHGRYTRPVSCLWLEKELSSELGEVSVATWWWLRLWLTQHWWALGFCGTGEAEGTARSRVQGWARAPPTPLRQLLLHQPPEAWRGRYRRLPGYLRSLGWDWKILPWPWSRRSSKHCRAPRRAPQEKTPICMGGGLMGNTHVRNFILDVPHF